MLHSRSRSRSRFHASWKAMPEIQKECVTGPLEKIVPAAQLEFAAAGAGFGRRGRPEARLKLARFDGCIRDRLGFPTACTRIMLCPGLDDPIGHEDEIAVKGAVGILAGGGLEMFREHPAARLCFYFPQDFGDGQPLPVGGTPGISSEVADRLEMNPSDIGNAFECKVHGGTDFMDVHARHQGRDQDYSQICLRTVIHRPFSSDRKGAVPAALHRRSPSHRRTGERRTRAPPP